MDRQCSSCGGFCRKSGCERENVVVDCYGYASRLAICLSEKHYKDSSPNWQPLDTLIGVLTQIDNMTSGLSREKNHENYQAMYLKVRDELAELQQREWVGLTDDEYESMAEQYVTNCYFDTLEYAKAIEAKLKDKNKAKK